MVVIINFIKTRFSRIRRILPQAFYFAAAIFAVLSAVIPSSKEPKNELIVIEDVSDSATRSETTRPEFISRLNNEAEIKHAILFAGKAMLMQGEQENKFSVENIAALSPGSTNIQQALERAAAIPRNGNTRRRILLISDGLETIGDAAIAAKNLSSSAVVETTTKGSTPTKDGKIISVNLPGVATTGSEVRLVATASSESIENAEIAIFEDKNELARKKVSLTPAGIQIPFTLKINGLGMHVYNISIFVEGDMIPENNNARAALFATGGNELLWVSRSFAPAWMSGENLQIVPCRPSDLPMNFSHKYCTVVLDNVSASELPANAGNMLKNAINGGTGLVVIGGKNSLGPGGYDNPDRSGIALEELLPLRLEPANSLALAICIDVSGSMEEFVGETGGQTNKLSLAVMSVIEAWKKLHPGDQVAVIAFSKKPEVVLPLTRVEEDEAELATIRAKLFDISSGGGTRMFIAIKKAMNVLDKIRARRKHIVVISDGDTEEKDVFLENLLISLETEHRKGHFGLSMIALGDKPDEKILDKLKKRVSASIVRANGQLMKLPSILSDELRKGRDYNLTSVNIKDIIAHEITLGMRPEIFAKIENTVATGPEKINRGAVKLLATDKGEPLAACWNYGAGRVAVLTGAPWLEWGWGNSKESKLLVRRILSWASSDENRKSGAAATVEDGRLRIDFTPGSGLRNPRTNFVVRIFKYDSGNELNTPKIKLYPDLPGVWRGESRTPEYGVYRIEVTDSADKDKNILASAPLVVEKRKEYLRSGVDGTALARIAMAGGGDIVATYKHCTPWEEIPVAGGEKYPDLNPTLIIATGIFFLLGLLTGALR